MSDAPEEKTKAELFAENPDQFENLKDVLLCIKKVDGKHMVMINQMSNHDIMAMAIAETQKKGSGILTPAQAGEKGGFRGFLKNGRR